MLDYFFKKGKGQFYPIKEIPWVVNITYRDTLNKFKPNEYELNYIILTTHFSYRYSKKNVQKRKRETCSGERLRHINFFGFRNKYEMY